MIVVDTHALLWLALEPRRLSAPATAAIRDGATSGGVAVAAISLWEIAMIVRDGRVRPRGTTEAWLTELLDRTGVVVQDITPAIATLATEFPDDFPRDPADRLIAATARAGGMALVTRDAAIRRSRLVRTIW